MARDTQTPKNEQHRREARVRDESATGWVAHGRSATRSPGTVAA
jgi:hypothetical protein